MLACDHAFSRCYTPHLAIAACNDMHKGQPTLHFRTGLSRKCPLCTLTRLHPSTNLARPQPRHHTLPSSMGGLSCVGPGTQGERLRILHWDNSCWGASCRCLGLLGMLGTLHNCELCLVAIVLSILVCSIKICSVTPCITAALSGDCIANSNNSDAGLGLP